MSGFRERVARRWPLGQNGKDTGMTGTEEMQDKETPAPGTEGAPLELEGANEEQSGQETDSQAAELNAVREERDALKDQIARLQAEFANARKRESKERQDARDYAVQSAVEPFLSVMDNFQLALKAEGSVEQLRAGVELILKQMEEALRGLNVQPVESVGTQFDPRVHEALASEERADVPDHQVLEEIRRGYRLRDKLLRPALVKIAANSKQISE
ncbi:MAG TPA: nucleotide exchange factor GrpE [Acidobacteriaceae bacterium]|nr:nucleotide exchange factor GrpE [Acidobacteriaceae bacterium]